jgi:hypothetical protein
MHVRKDPELENSFATMRKDRWMDATTNGCAPLLIPEHFQPNKVADTRDSYSCTILLSYRFIIHWYFSIYIRTECSIRTCCIA